MKFWILGNLTGYRNERYFNGRAGYALLTREEAINKIKWHNVVNKYDKLFYIQCIEINTEYLLAQMIADSEPLTRKIFSFINRKNADPSLFSYITLHDCEDISELLKE